MSIWRLVKKEILHRKLNFALGVLSVLAAAGCLVAEVTLLRAHDLRTKELLDRKEKQTDERLRGLTDEYRKLTLQIGFNVRILPKDQDLGEFYDAGFASKTMDEEFVHRLAGSKVLTSVQHLLPRLERRVEWPERKRKIILLGAHGEVPLREQFSRKPITPLIPAGRVDLGYELWRSLGLKAGDELGLLGQNFTVRKCYDEQGSRADITVWVDLAKAQELLGLEGRINEIQAVDCRCAWADTAAVRAEMAKILPETQVILTMQSALVRAQARLRAEQEQKQTLEQERAARDHLRTEREAFAGILVPLVIVGCAAWIALLALGNVRDRAVEIGILRAIGLRAGQIFGLFIARALLIGLIGAAAGCVAGFVVGAAWGGVPVVSGADALFRPWLFVAVLLAAPLLAALASWAPAMLAARQDPAVVFAEE